MKILLPGSPDGRSAVSDKYLAPAFDDVLTAMKNQPPFTLLMAWRRYIDASAGGGSGARRRYGYSVLRPVRRPCAPA